VKLEDVCARMQANASVLASLYDGLPDGQLDWRPLPQKWSLREVLGHLHDEEIDDFRTRVDLTLHHADQAWPGIDPEGWVTERGYAQWDAVATMSEWQRRRAETLQWLRSLDAPDWNRIYEHPQIGALSAGDLLLSWLTHDHLHIRQILKLHLEFHKEHGKPYSSRYAEP